MIEARGIDVTPANIDRLASNQDKKSAELLTLIYTDEITHVACGVKWFRNVVKLQNPSAD